MILYNVTINVDDQVHDEWLDWMVNEHIPMVMATDMFINHKMFRILSRFQDETGTSYSIQYFAETMADYEIYKEVYAPALQQETLNKFGERCVAFRTLLEEV